MSMIPTIPTRKPVTLSWDEFVAAIGQDVPLSNAPVIDEMWERAEEGKPFVLSLAEEDLFNSLQSVA